MPTSRPNWRVETSGWVSMRSSGWPPRWTYTCERHQEPRRWLAAQFHTPHVALPLLPSRPLESPPPSPCNWPDRRQQRQQAGACFYCGQTEFMHVNQFVIPVTLSVSNSVFSVCALLDSGSAGNFMSQSLVSSLHIHTRPLSKSVLVHATRSATPP